METAVVYTMLAMTLHEAPTPTIELLAATVAAVTGSWSLVGNGDRNAVDGAAVDAMRYSLSASEFGGIVVIGEGEKDEAPMLFNGELLGQGNSIDWDVAVDPIDGTKLAAAGTKGAVSVIAASERGTMLDCHEVYYMKKLVSSGVARGVLDIDASVSQNVSALAKALEIPVTDVRVAVINKPINQELIREVEASGAQWVRFDEGDIAMAVAAATEGTGVDLLLGIGGAPEGVVTAVAIRVLGGYMQGILAPQTPDEIERALQAGYALDKKFELEDLVGGDRHIFVLTGVTDGILVDGVREEEGELVIQSMVLDSALDGARLVEVKVDA
jgi:fructose-1,6-bisphosphatase II